MSSPSEPQGGSGGRAGTFGFLTHKWGPLPAWVWVGGGLGAVLIAKKAGLSIPGLGSSSSSSASEAIDPQTQIPYTEEVYDPSTGAQWSSEYASLLNQQLSSTGTGSTSTNTSPYINTTYQDNNAWSVAAINYLTSLGYSSTVATKAIEDYLNGTTLPANEQQMVDAATRQLGAAPNPPTPAGGTVPPPSGGGTGTTGTKTYVQNAPGNLHTTTVTATSVGLAWGALSNATGYSVFYGEEAHPYAQSKSTDGKTASITITGLKPNTKYVFHVHGTPTKPGSSTKTAQVTATTKKK